MAGAAWAQPAPESATAPLEPPAVPGNSVQPPAAQPLPPPPLTPLRFALGAARAEQAPFYWALKQGGYKEAGIALRISTDDNAAKIAQQVGTGRLQLGLVDLATALQSSAGGAAVVAIMNLYGHVLIANREYLNEQGDVVRGFVRATQMAFADCAKNPDPCVAQYARARRQSRADVATAWRATAAALSQAASRKTFGVFHPDAVRADYQALIAKGTVKPFDLVKAYSNAYLDPVVKLP
ncbi:MAG: ABC transporter substrate-binding protein [Gammaproteobacteria bacterium]